MAALAFWMAQRSPSQRLGLAGALGLLSVLALPPFQAFPLLWLTLPGLLWLLDGVTTGRAAFALGWVFGMGWFVGGLQWIGYAFFVDAETFGALAVPAVLALSAFLSLYHGITLWLLYRSQVAGVAKVVLFAAVWTLAEMARGRLFTGFPWNPLALVWADVLPVLQSTSVIGASGLSLLTVLLAAMPFTLASRRYRPFVLSLLGLGVLAGMGLARIPAHPMPTVPGVILRLVQPAIPQAQKWDPAASAEGLGRYLSMSRHGPHGQAPGAPPPTALIWGETAVPYALDGVNREVEHILAEALPLDNPNALLITGVARRSPVGQRPYEVWNSLQVFDHAARTLASYDKAHLVPGGEYIPLHQYIPIAAIAAEVDYSHGPHPLTFDLPGLPPMGALVCYEIIFPGQVVDPHRRPAWLVNLTNDGWFTGSTGPLQHFAMTRLRAIEEGLPVVRTANTGISGVIDPYGRVLATIGQGVADTLDSPLPQALLLTVYGRWGETIPLTLALLSVFVAFLLKRHR